MKEREKIPKINSWLKAKSVNGSPVGIIIDPATDENLSQEEFDALMEALEAMMIEYNFSIKSVMTERQMAKFYGKMHIDTLLFVLEEQSDKMLDSDEQS